MAMVDASIGGKVAVNHPLAKNLIGSFYQPKVVLADLQVLLTLPVRERVSGWAEVIKHGLLSDPDFVTFLEKSAGRLLACEPDALVEAVERSAGIKAAIVSDDEREAGRRIILNYGHTVAHGIEAASDYLRFFHGEAVSVGMVAAGRISRELGVMDGMLEERQTALLKCFGLPVSVDGVNMEQVRAAIGLDKKAHGGSVRWVLLEDIGHPIVRPNVPESLVTATLNELLK
jgi:3-dehydroquinate synthase